MEFRIHDIRSAPEGSGPLLEKAQKSMGFIPNLYGHLAAAPSALKAYLELSRLFESSSLSPVEQQAVLLAASVENRCEFCVVLGVSLKTLSNYVNHLAGTRTNRELADYAWQAP